MSSETITETMSAPVSLTKDEVEAVIRFLGNQISYGAEHTPQVVARLQILTKIFSHMK